MMKPSTAMLKDEVQRFSDVIRPVTADMRPALTLLCMVESSIQEPWRRPDHDDAVDRLGRLITGSSNCGSNAFVDGKMVHENQRDFIASLAKDNTPESGLRVLATKVLKIIAFFADEVEIDDEILDFIDHCQTWTVQGKLDGYKMKKLDVGRSIQAASCYLKALWLVCFRDNDDKWVARNHFFRAGADQDMPILGDRKNFILKAQACVALDGTAWDRYMDNSLIKAFFMHLGFLNPGIPPKLIRFLREVTSEGDLVFTDGTKVRKTRGNPSGHPATLRLNSVVNMLIWLHYFLTCATPDEIINALDDGDVFPEFVGDDSRVWASGKCIPWMDADNGAKKIIEHFNTHFPWEMKLEGTWQRNDQVTFAEDIIHAPPFASRGVAWIDGMMHSVWVDPGRLCRKLMHDAGRTPAQEKELVGSMNNVMAMLDYWDRQGIIVCPVVRTLRSFPDWDINVSDARAADVYRHGMLGGGL